MTLRTGEYTLILRRKL